MNDKYIGSGVKFPPQVNKKTGRFELSGGDDSIRESIYIILMTAKTERWLNQGFGSNMMSYAFMDTSPTMISMMKDDIFKTIISQEPRISDLDIDVEFEQEESRLLINLDYVTADGYTKGSMVFPFYLETGGTEENES